MLTRINPMISFFEFTKGQYFTMHPEMPDQRDEGDISRFTILVYLNENFQGGREEFETLGEIGAPKTGAALIYEQYKKEISHNIVKTGTKYVMRLELEYCREKNFHDVLSKFDRTTRTLIKHVRADLVPSGMAVPRKPRPTQAPRGAPQGSGNDDDNPNLRDLFKRGQQFAAAQEQLKKNMRDRNNGMEQTSQESEVVKDRKKPKKRRIPKLWGKRQ
ncbi:oxidoreductase [Penicillium macrosclerotiorum]|uniref:oxidoreductase n=1 Tax=Penicillium macrosclerotiorum TaxID=303699 RepID=UPI00254799E3|nr:oxidoreductase [Penicillium macrosclerotiorum]KAJ5698690.1 oxidoreductase [Penicillium macrosclerotiorum]